MEKQKFCFAYITLFLLQLLDNVTVLCCSGGPFQSLALLSQPSQSRCNAEDLQCHKQKKNEKKNRIENKNADIIYYHQRLSLHHNRHYLQHHYPPGDQLVSYLNNASVLLAKSQHVVCHRSWLWQILRLQIENWEEIEAISLDWQYQNVSFFPRTCRVIRLN